MLIYDETLPPYTHLGDYSVGARGFDPITDLGASSGELVFVIAEATVGPDDPTPTILEPSGWGWTRTGATFVSGPLMGQPVRYRAGIFHRRLVVDAAGTVNFFSAGALAYRLKALRFTGGGIARTFVGAGGAWVPNAPPAQIRSLNDATYEANPQTFVMLGFSSGRQSSDGAFLDGSISLDVTPDGTIGTAVAHKAFTGPPPDVEVSMTTVGNGTTDYNVLMSILMGPGA